jgi:hypothetical protein
MVGGSSMSDRNIRALERKVAQEPDDFNLRLKLIKEQVRLGIPSFSYSLIMETVDLDLGEGDGQFVEEDVSSTFDNIMSSAKSNYIEPRGNWDLTSWWESDRTQDYATGEVVWHSLHVEYANGQRLHTEMFDIFNQAIRNHYRTPEEFLTDED